MAFARPIWFFSASRRATLGSPDVRQAAGGRTRRPAPRRPGGSPLACGQGPSWCRVGGDCRVEYTRPLRSDDFTLEATLKLVLAPQVPVRLDEPQHFRLDDLSRYPSVEVSDDSPDLLEHVVDDAIRKHGRLVVGAEKQVDAPPYRAGTWWLASLTEGDGDGDACVTSFPPSYFYGIDVTGRVHFLHRDELRVDDLARAVSEGHYGPTDGTLLVTRAGEFGGNGAVVPSLVAWLLEVFPGVLLGVGADRLVLRHDEAKRAELQKLAGLWTARHIAFPSSLRQFVETRSIWYPEALGRRLDLSPAAATRLLRELGYQDCGEDMLEFDGSSDAEAARDRWLDVERSHSGFATLDELLDGTASASESSTRTNGPRPVPWWRRLLGRRD